MEASAPAAGSSTPSAALVTLLTDLSLHALAASLHSTALFYAERLQALTPSAESATWLLALCLLRDGQAKATVRLLSQTFVALQPRDVEERAAGKGKGRARDVFGDEHGGLFAGWSSGWGAEPTQKVAYLASVRCASLYAQACAQLGRPKEGHEILRRAISERGTPQAADLAVPSPSSAFSLSSLHALVGSLALRSADLARAASSFKAALADPTGPLVWEAFEGLCKTGDPSATADVFDQVYQALGSTPQASVAQPANGLANGAPQARSPESRPVFFTPAETHGGSPARPVPHEPPRKSMWEATALGKGINTGEMSVDDSSLASFDQSYYALGQQGRDNVAGKPLWQGMASQGNHAAPAPAQAGASTLQSGFLARNPSSSSSFATPSGNDGAPPKPPPGVKRTRAGVANGISAAKGATRGNGVDVTMSPEPPIVTRRSDRIRETTADGRPIAGSSRLTRGSGATGRDRKRAKSGDPHSDAGDATCPEVGLRGARALSPIPSSSPEPPPGQVNGTATHPQPTAGTTAPGAEDPERAAAIAWTVNVMRRFGKATLALSRFDSQGVLDAVWGLPPEQKRTWRAYCLIARAKFELLDYHSAQIAFTKARQCAPYLVQNMDLCSTLLWHLRKPVELSCLAQELQALDPHASESWIATGNVFSLIDDHANALRCFKRAVQVDESRPYAFTLSGHECVGLEEWDRALGFFREAIRRDSRHYNAWFGMGDVYLKQGQLRMAEYHFRQAAALNPTNALLLCAIGNVLEKRGKPKEAKELYEQGVALAPKAATVRFYRAKVLVSLKQYEAARIDLIMLKDAEPTEFNVHFLLGKVYALTGDKAAATREMAYAQDLDPRAAARIRKVLEGESDIEDNSRDEPIDVQTRLDEVGE